MKKILFVSVSVLFVINTIAQKAPVDSKVFWTETFKTNKLPEGWRNVDKSGKDLQWLVTNQPYPGSYQYQQQAPPIASKSRGYHLQFQAGYFVDEDQESWIKNNWHPDTWVQTGAIDCSGRSSVILRFQETFRYNAEAAGSGAGLFVGISTDGANWKDINVMNDAPPARDMFTPSNQELNISDLAANQPKIFIRFYWRGYYSWYWMIDDIELAEAYGKDLAVESLTSHPETGNTFTSADVLAIAIKNSGTSAIKSDFSVSCTIDGKRELTSDVPASDRGIAPGDKLIVRFPATDLTDLPAHSLKFTIHYADDEKLSNNELSTKIYARETHIGNLTAFKQNQNEFDISAGHSDFKVIFYTNAIFRIWMAPNGEFTDPAGDDIVTDHGMKNPSLSAEDKGSYYRLKSNACVVRVYKTPLRFALYDIRDSVRIWEESEPLSFGARTTQTMERQSNEYFYGCGMQNGYFSHRDKNILIEKGGGWDDGGRANPAPFYLSTAGYGAFRNTFDAGAYSFKEKLSFTHNENRFDCYYFYGPSLKTILNEYTAITGRPFLMPRWGLSLGDANCYNRGVKGDDTKNDRSSGISGTTPDVIHLVADKYVEHDMPRGWILPNDGYGCGYTKLDSTIMELHKRGFYTGLWTESGVDKIAKEVGEYGSRVAKLDVAWVGPGYKYAMDACKAAFEGIEHNSDARGFVWSVMGWAGTQRYSTVWSGDQKGNWEYIRFHIPTVIGSGLSAQNAATGDVDGIFGGSDSTYVRDLQWKCFTPVFMVMSGWAKKDKQPYIYGEPYTSINRKYLQLKMRLTPYMYTYCAKAHETGIPTSRAMVLEYPDDPTTWGKSTQYQFMNGEWLLVAPVYKSEGKRDSIYLPRGTWYDYWDGKPMQGNRWLNDYPSPLDKLPLFVKAGAIIPMYPQMNYDGEKKTDTLTLDIYPSQRSSFELYEDDGLTRQYQSGAFAKTLIEVNAGDNIVIRINAARGHYQGKNAKRVYLMDIHRNRLPQEVTIKSKKIPRFDEKRQFDQAQTGYFYDANEKGGIIHIKTPYLSTSESQIISLMQ
jgi:alpha-glucosidase